MKGYMEKNKSLLKGKAKISWLESWRLKRAAKKDVRLNTIKVLEDDVIDSPYLRKLIDSVERKKGLLALECIILTASFRDLIPGDKNAIPHMEDSVKTIDGALKGISVPDSSDIKDISAELSEEIRAGRHLQQAKEAELSSVRSDLEKTKKNLNDAFINIRQIVNETAHRIQIEEILGHERMMTYVTEASRQSETSYTIRGSIEEVFSKIVENLYHQLNEHDPRMALEEVA